MRKRHWSWDIKDKKTYEAWGMREEPGAGRRTRMWATEGRPGGGGGDRGARLQS